MKSALVVLLLSLATVAYAGDPVQDGPRRIQWPSIAKEQSRWTVSVNIGCGGDGSGEECINDWGDMGGGGTNATYGTCKTNYACSLAYGACEFRVYSKCQDKVWNSGPGDACRGC